MTSAEPPAGPRRPWWREPMLWLVIGGPAIVVVAAVVTAIIAVRGADPVLDTRGTRTAVQGRNLANTPTASGAATAPVQP